MTRQYSVWRAEPPKIRGSVALSVEPQGRPNLSSEPAMEQKMITVLVFIMAQLTLRVLNDVLLLQVGSAVDTLPKKQPGEELDSRRSPALPDELLVLAGRCSSREHDRLVGRSSSEGVPRRASCARRVDGAA